MVTAFKQSLNGNILPEYGRLSAMPTIEEESSLTVAKADPFPFAAAALVTLLDAAPFLWATCFNATDLFNPENEGRLALTPQCGMARLGAEADALQPEADLTANEPTQEREDEATEEAAMIYERKEGA